MPYDQTNPVMDDPTAPPVDAGAAPPPDPMGGAGGAQGMPMLAQAGAMGAGGDPTTDGMSDVDLQGLGAGMQQPGAGDMQGLQSPEDMQLAQMEQALADPNTSPDERAAIEAQLAIAARRRMAGVGGLG